MRFAMLTNETPNSHGTTLSDKVNKFIEKGYEPFGSVNIIQGETCIISSIGMINKDKPPFSPKPPKGKK